MYKEYYQSCSTQCGHSQLTCMHLPLSTLIYMHSNPQQANYWTILQMCRPSLKCYPLEGGNVVLIPYTVQYCTSEISTPFKFSRFLVFKERKANMSNYWTLPW